ncbi:MAG: tyrosine-type recombinase/integrase [Acidobacteria bacterium]|nr:tyrosine-type recombinase/integrase [Acidobacteriota bacterium]
MRGRHPEKSDPSLREIPIRVGLDEWIEEYMQVAGWPTNLTPHSFRVMVVTALLSQNIPVEEVPHLVGHSHPSTTQLYDRRR